MIKSDLESILGRLIDARNIYAFELSEMPEGKLLCLDGKDGKRYYVRNKVGNEWKRKGITKNKELIALLARKAYLEKALRSINHNIGVLEKAIRAYKPFDPDTMIEEMTKGFKGIPRDMFYDSSVDVVALSLDASDVKKIASHAAWGAEPYTPSSFHQEDLVLVTSKGEHMRSKAELLIAEKLYEYGIPFRYEQELPVEGGILIPDFTFEGAGGKPFYLEFCGMMGDAGYANAHKRKRATYEANGINEWTNMIYVYSSDNDMNMMMIDSIIRNRIIPKL